MMKLIKHSLLAFTLSGLLIATGFAAPTKAQNPDYYKMYKTNMMDILPALMCDNLINAKLVIESKQACIPHMRKAGEACFKAHDKEWAKPFNAQFRAIHAKAMKEIQGTNDPKVKAKAEQEMKAGFASVGQKFGKTIGECTATKYTEMYPKSLRQATKKPS